MTVIGPGDQAWSALLAVLWLTGGTLLGTLYFLTLRWNILLMVRHAPVVAAAVQLVRFAFLAAALAAVAGRFGAPPLLLTAAGIRLARPAVMRSRARP